MNPLTPARLSMIMLMVVGGLIAADIARGLMAVEELGASNSPTVNASRAASDVPVGTRNEPRPSLGSAVAGQLVRAAPLTNQVSKDPAIPEATAGTEPIRSSQLFEREPAPPLHVQKGMRALTIGLGEAAIVDGLLNPGEFVDVHFSPTNLQNDPRIGIGMTITLFRGVRILAINRFADRSGVPSQAQGGESSVTLELSEGQANVILMARDKGSLYFSSNPDGRGSGDLAVAGKGRITLEEVLGLEPLPRADSSPQPVISQLFRGVSMQQYTFTKVGNRMMQTEDATKGGTGSQALSPRGRPEPGAATDWLSGANRLNQQSNGYETTHGRAD